MNIMCPETNPFNEKDSFGYTPLLRAARAGNWKMVRWFIEQGGAKADIVDPNQDDAFSLACQSGNWEMVKWLIETGRVKVDIASSNSNTALKYARAAGNLEMVAWLIQTGRVKVDIASSNPNTALTRSPIKDVDYAGSKEQPEMVKPSIEQVEAKVDIVGPSQDQALNLACQSGNWEMVKWLIEQGGAKLDTKSSSSVGLKYAGSKEHREMLKWLGTQGADVNTLCGVYGRVKEMRYECEADQEASWQEIRALVNNCEINKSMLYANASLLLTAEYAQWDIVKTLVEKGANINATSQSANITIAKVAITHGVQGGDTNLMYHAIQDKNPRMVQWLVEKGIDMTFKGPEGHTALTYMAYMVGAEAASRRAGRVGEYFRCFQQCIEKGANVNEKGADNMTALMHFASFSIDTYVSYLIREKRVDVNAQCSKGKTALMYAIEAASMYEGRGTYRGIIEELIAAGSNLQLQDSQRKTVLEYIVERGVKKGTDRRYWFALFDQIEPLVTPAQRARVRGSSEFAYFRSLRGSVRGPIKPR